MSCYNKIKKSRRYAHKKIGYKHERTYDDFYACAGAL